MSDDKVVSFKRSESGYCTTSREQIDSLYNTVIDIPEDIKTTVDIFHSTDSVKPIAKESQNTSEDKTIKVNSNSTFLNIMSSSEIVESQDREGHEFGDKDKFQFNSATGDKSPTMPKLSFGENPLKSSTPFSKDKCGASKDGGDDEDLLHDTGMSAQEQRQLDFVINKVCQGLAKVDLNLSLDKTKTRSLYSPSDIPSQLKPSCFEGQSNPTLWVEKFLKYCDLKNLDKGDKLVLFKSLMSGRSELWLSQVEDAYKKDIDRLLTKFLDFWTQQGSSRFHLLQQFRNRKLQPGESISSLANSLVDLAKWANLSQTQIREQLIMSLPPSVKTSVLSAPHSDKLNLHEIITLAESAHSCIKESENLENDKLNKIMKEINTSIEENMKKIVQNQVSHMPKYNPGFKNHRYVRTVQNDHSFPGPGVQPEQGRHQQPNWRSTLEDRSGQFQKFRNDIICYNCGNAGHIKSQCRRFRNYRK